MDWENHRLESFLTGNALYLLASCGAARLHWGWSLLIAAAGFSALAMLYKEIWWAGVSG